MFFPKGYNLVDPIDYYMGKESVLKENKELKDEIEFYKSIFKMRDSCIFNLSIKKKKGERVWFDRVRTSYSDLITYDMDDELRDMIYNPPRPER
jgi:hypothetical protein